MFLVVVRTTTMFFGVWENEWWTKQIGFSGEGDRHKPTGQFLRNQVKDGPVESDWFVEAREGLTQMRHRIAH